jgi:subtilisin family serine protease
MVATRFTKIFSIAVIVTFLLSAAESAKNDDAGCPETLSISANSNGKMKKHIVVFENKDAAEKQCDMLKKCLKAEIGDFASIKSLKSKKNAFASFSINKLNGISGEMTESFAKNLQKMSGVKYVELDGEVKTQYAVPSRFTRRAVDNSPTPNDDRIDQAKGPGDGKFAFPDSAGKGVNIFVVDTGVRVTHEEFEGRAKFGGSFCDGCNDEDENGHGTHVSSIAAGKTLGVARKANIIGIRVLDADGAGSNSGVIDGLNAVLKMHEESDNKNSVVNMSLGGQQSKAVNDAVNQLTDAGVHVVVAAGNESQDACNTSPASEPSAITVGATEKKNDDITDFSNFGKCVDIFAPGRDIQGAGIQNDNDEQVFSGTSQACPHVAGTVALIIAENGNESPAKMAESLADLSTKGVVGKLGNNGSPNRFLRVPAA